MAAACNALISLMHTIDIIQLNPSTTISLTKQQVESLIEKATFLLEFLEAYDSHSREEADPLEMRIADAAYAVEDAIESHIVDGICLDSGAEELSSVDLQKKIEDMDLIKKEVELRRNVLASSSGSLRSVRVGVSDAALTRSSSSMVGFDDLLLRILDMLTSERSDRQVIPIVGMGGIGKTTLARNAFTHPLVKGRFDFVAWTTFSQKYNTRDILLEILYQADDELDAQLSRMGEGELGLALHKYLTNRRFLIVLDDLWSLKEWEEIQLYFPNNYNRSRILVTSRLSILGSQLDDSSALEMRFLDKDSGWDLFTKIVFGENSCPYELEQIGEKIVKSCKGLPLSIVVVGGLLKKLEHTQECWESIRMNLNSVVNLENDEHCLKILRLSYNHLPLHLKPCFLHMGEFEEDSVIRVSKVVKLWVSKGCVKPKPSSDESLKTIAREYLKDLVDRNLIIAHELGSTGNIKNFKIHDLLRDFCLREAEKEMLHKSMQASESVCLLPNSRLLSLMKAFDQPPIRRLEYDLGSVSKVLNSRYRDVEAQLPVSMNLLWRVETLTVAHPRRKINAPVEIWMMPQLRHVHFEGRGMNLPDPPTDNFNFVVLENLQTLTGVRNFKCGEEAVKRIPNIRKLGIKYHKYMRFLINGSDYYCLHNLECLNKLESLTCEGHRIGSCLKKLSFPHSLKKLTLSTSLPPNLHEMFLAKIGSLPLLEKLKFTSNSGAKHEWETAEDRFQVLKFLSLEGFGNLKYWIVKSSHFPRLQHLHLVGLTNLKQISSEVGEIPTLQSIVLHRCSLAAVKCVKKIVDEQEEVQGKEQLPFRVRVRLRESYPNLEKLSSPNFEVTAPVTLVGSVILAAGIPSYYQYTIDE